MSTPFLSEIKIFSFAFAPRGWAMCNGQLLPINQNQALFSLLGTRYGGNGQTTFGLPELRGRAPLHQGNGFLEGQNGGEESHTLTLSEMPAHTHLPAAVSNTAPNQGSMAGNRFAPMAGTYHTSPDTTLNPASVSNVGGSQAHRNDQPYLVLNFCIALQGIFPSRN